GLLSPGLLGPGLLSLSLRRLTSVLGLCRPTGLRRLTGSGVSSLNLAGLGSLSLAGCPGSVLGLTTGVHLGLGHDNSFSPLFLAAPAPGTTWRHRCPGLTPAPVRRNTFPGGLVPGTRRHSGRGPRAGRLSRTPRTPAW